MSRYTPVFHLYLQQVFTKGQHCSCLFLLATCSGHFWLFLWEFLCVDGTDAHLTKTKNNHQREWDRSIIAYVR